MGELPVFTCQAHVFSINPSTRKSWVQSSSKAVDINFFYDSNKQCYRIVSVEDGPTGKKVVINSTITDKMVFKQTSQKFGQWADPKSSGVFGLGFNSEADLTRFVTQFRQCVEATKQNNAEALKRGGVVKPGENSQPSTLKNGQPNSPGLLMMGEQRTTLPLPTTPPILNTFQSSGGTYSTPSVPPRSSDGQMAGEIVGGGQQLMHQTHYQAQILRLERELATVRRQASGCTDPPSPLKPNYDGSFEFDRLHLAGSCDGTGGSSGTNGSSSLTVHKLPPPVLLNTMSPGLIEVPSFDLGSGGVDVASDSTSVLLKLHSRLGSVLREACDLHKQIGHLLVVTTTNPACSIANAAANTSANVPANSSSGGTSK